MFTYPIYKKSKRSNAVIKFTSLTAGTIIKKGNGGGSVGTFSHNWIRHTDIVRWTPIINLYL